MDNYNNYIIDWVLKSRIAPANGTTGSAPVEEVSANLQSSSDGSGWTIDKTYADLQALQAKGILTSLAWHREDGSIVTVPLTSTGPVDGKDAFVFSTILTTADGSTFNAFILDEDDVLTYVTEDIGGGGGGGVDTAFKVVGLKDGHPDVLSPSKKIIYLTKEAGSTARDPYTEWIYTDDSQWQIIGETSVDLTDYAKKEDLDNYATKTDIANKPDVSGDHLGGQLASFLPDNNLMGSGIYASDVATKNDLSGKLDTIKHPQANDIPIITASGQLDSSSKSINDVVFQTDLDDYATKDDLNGYKPKQTAVVDPEASGNAVSFIDSISQDANGVITATKKTPPLVTQDNTAGLMSSADKIKLDGIEAGAEANVQSNWGEINPESPAYIVNKPGLATQSVSGLMSQYDKQKLDGIELGAQVNTIASISVNGAPQIPDQNKNVDLTIGTSGGIQGVKLAGASEPITPDASDIVTIPNATSASSQDATNGLMTASDKQKLDGVSTGANKVEASTTPGDGSIRVDGSSVSVYVHPTTAGNKHVPAGGAEHNILCYGGSSGVAVWDSDEYEDVDIVVPVIESVTVGDKTYPVVKIGTRYWMAENLDFKLPSSVANSEFNPPQYYYVDDPDWRYYSYYYRGAVKYDYNTPAGSSQPPVEGHGLLYNWSAVKYISDNAETLLPPGWRVPTNTDLYALQNDAGGYSVAGTHLKSTTGWSDYSGAGNGDDSFGFAALPTGYRNIQTASLNSNVVPFQNINESTGFWSSTEHQQTTSEAYVLTLRYSSNQTSYGSQSKKLGYSIRLVMDAE